MGQRLIIRVFLAGCLTAHAVLLLVGARRNFSGIDEAAHVAAGLSHWQTGTFSLYRVNPPLPDLLSALPVWLARPTTDFSKLTPAPDVRPEWNFGWDFARANRDRFLELLFLARLPGVAWSLAAAWVIYLWARDLYGERAGCLSVFVWCFDPTVLAWAQAVTGDLPSATAAVASTYAFWRYLKAPGWHWAIVAGVLLGVALLTKFTLLLFFVIWPILALLQRPWRGGGARRFGVVVAQGALVVVLSLAVLNLGYGFRGSFRRLRDFDFVSQALSGRPRPGAADASASGALGDLGNRFRGTALGDWVVPVPADYLSGIDVLRVDFEDRLESYLCGEWRNGGWWYYYLVALAVKEPLGPLALAAWAVTLVLLRRPGGADWSDEWTWLLPAFSILAFVSSQTGTNHHVRYVLPAFPFVAVGIGRLARGLEPGRRAWGLLVLVLLGWSAATTMRIYPHVMSYFNEAAGGPGNGGKFLNDSNLDWGQDLLFLKEWLDAHPEAKPLGLAYYNYLDPALVGIVYRLPPPGPPLRPPEDPVEAARFGPRPGYFAVSVNYLLGARFLAPDGRGGVRPIVRRSEFAYFNRFTPIARAGYSINIYKISPSEANAVREQLGLPPLLGEPPP